MTAEVERPAAVGLSVAVQIVLVLVGAGLFTGAVVADEAWFDRHFLPLFSLSRQGFLARETLGRVLVGGFGLFVVLVIRGWLGRLVARHPPGALAAATLRIALAVSLALLVAEPILRRAVRAATEASLPGQEPLRRPDARLGWSYVPNHAGVMRLNGRAAAFVVDPMGARVESLDRRVDPAKPSILFAGESVIGGYGLPWNEAIPAKTAARLGLQAADLSVFAYANDQAYLRIVDALPRFRQPVAVVSPFMPGLVFRDLNTDRPHLDPDLAWRPARPRWRLAALALYLAPYHTEAAIRAGVDKTRAALQATQSLACARGARAVVLAPVFGSESAAEARLSRAVLDGSGLEVVRVRLDPRWRLPGDRHPDARAADAMAQALAARLSGPGKPCP